MPKIIENLESRLLEEARKQLFQMGYGALTIRKVAKACGVGIGTMYNYFSSKDEMITTIMQKDLEQCVQQIRNTAARSDSAQPVVRCIYDQLVEFATEHRVIFLDRAEAAAFLGSFDVHREQLRNQIAQVLRAYCDSEFASQFIAEALLTWTMGKKDFEEIYDLIQKLFTVPHP